MDKLIDANNLINCLQIMSTKNDSKVWEQCIEIVNSLPDEQRYGRWIYKKNMGYFCSACIESGLSPTNADDNCGYSLDGTMKYCWNCGAKMIETI